MPHAAALPSGRSSVPAGKWRTTNFDPSRSSADTHQVEPAKGVPLRNDSERIRSSHAGISIVSELDTFNKSSSGFHTLRIVGSDVSAGVATRDAAVLGGDPAHGQAAALKQLWALAWREAQTMTYADAFYIISICFACATAMVPLMSRVAPSKGPSADAH